MVNTVGWFYNMSTDALTLLPLREGSVDHSESDSIWFPRLSQKRPWSIYFVHWTLMPGDWSHRERNVIIPNLPCWGGLKWSSHWQPLWTQPSKVLDIWAKPSWTLWASRSASWVPLNDLCGHHGEQKNHPGHALPELLTTALGDVIKWLLL